MKKFMFTVTCLVLAFSFFLLMGAVDKNQTRYGVSLEISPYKSGNYYCSVSVRDLESGEIINSPRIVCSKGQRASVTSNGNDGLSAYIAIDENAKGVAYTVELLHNGSRVFAQESNILLSL